MKRLMLVSSLLVGLCQTGHAVEKSEFIGRWKMTSYACASGKPINIGSDAIADLKLDLVLNVVSSDRAEGKIDYSYSFKDSFVKENRKKLTDALADLKAAPASPEISKMIAEYKVMIAKFDKDVQPRTCSNITRMSYYLRGNTMYTNDLNNLSTCTDPDDDGTDNGIDLEASTIDIKGNQLVVTEGREVEKNSTCPVNDRTVFTFVRD